MVRASHQHMHGKCVQSAEKEDKPERGPKAGLAEHNGQSQNAGTDHSLQINVEFKSFLAFCLPSGS